MSLAASRRILAIANLRGARTLTGGTPFKRQEKAMMSALSAVDMRHVQGGDGVSSPKGGWNYSVSCTSAV